MNEDFLRYSLGFFIYRQDYFVVYLILKLLSKKDFFFWNVFKFEIFFFGMIFYIIRDCFFSRDGVCVKVMIIYFFSILVGIDLFD